MLSMRAKDGGSAESELRQSKKCKVAFESVLTALDTYREVSKKSGKEFEQWREDARRSLDFQLLGYLGFSESDTIRHQRELLRIAYAFLNRFTDDEALELRTKIKSEIGDFE